MCCIKFVTLFDNILALFGTIVYAWYFIGVSEAATFSFGCDDIPTEVETRNQSRRRRTVVRGRLLLSLVVVVLQCLLQCQRRMFSRAVGRGIRQWYVSLQLGIFLWRSIIGPHFLWLLFQTTSVLTLLLPLSEQQDRSS